MKLLFIGGTGIISTAITTQLLKIGNRSKEKELVYLFMIADYE